MNLKSLLPVSLLAASAWQRLLLALVAAVFGFGGIASTAVGIAKILFVLFLVIAVVMLVVSFLLLLTINLLQAWTRGKAKKS